MALIEIASPGNKDRSERCRGFREEGRLGVAGGLSCRGRGPVSPGPHDPCGLHGAFWGDYRDEEDEEDGFTEEGPLTLASYVAKRLPDAYVAPLAVGEALPDMPLFLTPDAYVPLPLGNRPTRPPTAGCPPIGAGSSSRPALGDERETSGPLP